MLTFQILLVNVVLSSYILSARGCSAKNHPHLLKKLPKIFTFSPDKVKSDKLCSKQSKLLKKSDREYSSCHLVDVNLHSFLAPTASICLIPSSISTNSVEDGDDCSQVNLIKSSQLGLDVAVQSSLSPATAQVSYNSSTGDRVSFMLKGGKVFGSVSGKENQFNLEPCLGIKNCHLWLQISKKSSIS